MATERTRWTLLELIQLGEFVAANGHPPVLTEARTPAPLWEAVGRRAPGILWLKMRKVPLQSLPWSIKPYVHNGSRTGEPAGLTPLGSVPRWSRGWTLLWGGLDRICDDCY